MAHTATHSSRPDHGTASPDEVARFAAMADQWWETEGAFKPLHRLNPTRIAFIRDHVADHWARDPIAEGPLGGLDLLDVGCGGGLLTEPMCRLGARVTGIDAAMETIRTADHHAKESGLAIQYRDALPEKLAGEGKQFDVVLTMEVVEHVSDLDGFLKACSTLVKPGGVMVVSTINRTVKSFALAKVAAEYLLRWVKPGTHDWRKFVRPSELSRGLRDHGMRVTDLKGLTYGPVSGTWRLTQDLNVNYLAFAVKD